MNLQTPSRRSFRIFVAVVRSSLIMVPAAFLAFGIWIGLELSSMKPSEVVSTGARGEDDAANTERDIPEMREGSQVTNRSKTTAQPANANGGNGALASRLPPRDKQQQDAALKALPEREQASLGQALFEARHAVEPLNEREAAMEQNRDVRFFASNPGQQITARFCEDRVRFGSGSGGDWQAIFSYVESGGALATPVATMPSADGHRVEYGHAHRVTEWYENGREGIEHGFTIEQRLPGSAAGEVYLNVAVDGLQARYSATNPGELDLVTPEGVAVLAYGKLKVVDASGREVPARLEPAAHGLAIFVAEAGATYPLTVDPLITSLEANLTASDAAAGALFGWAVAIDGDTAVVGATDVNTIVGRRTGSAYVFVRNGANWTRQATLAASDGAAYDYLGCSVCLSGETALVGALPANQSTDPGKAYVFVRSGQTWVQQAKLTASDAIAQDYFGFSAAFSGDTAVIGAYQRQTQAGAGAGSAYVFVRSGTTWTQQAELMAADGTAGSNFGYTVSLSGNTVVVGAVADDTIAGANSGSAYVFVRSGTIWTQQAKLTSGVLMSGDRFGCAVAVNGETAIIGAYTADTAVGVDAGSAYVFVRSGTTWTQQARLTPDDQAAGDWFGAAVALSGDTALVKSQLNFPTAGVQTGAAYVFVRTGNVWTQQTKLLAGDMARSDLLVPTSVAISGNAAIVGAYQDDSRSEIDCGSASIFVRSGTNWTLQTQLNAGDGAAGDNFGSFWAIDGGTVLVGAYSDDTAAGVDAGSAYVFVRSGAVWSLQQKLVATGPSLSKSFGSAVALKGDTALVGSDSDDTLTASSVGSAYVFVRNGNAWTQQARLTADAGMSYDYFGCWLDVDGNTALIGTRRTSDSAGGRAYVFVRNGSSWTQQARLTASGGVAGDLVGRCVALSGDTALLGAYKDDVSGAVDAGSAYVFVRNGTVWSEQAKLTASDSSAGALFGRGVALNGDTAIIGASGTKVSGVVEAGSAYVFVRNGTTWSQQTRLTGDNPNPHDLFGRYVAVEGDTALIAVPSFVGNGSSVGVFVRSGTQWTQRAKLISGSTEVLDQFGVGVALSGDTALVGANADDTVAGVDAGSVYLFRLHPSQIVVEQPAGQVLSETAGSVFLGNALAGNSAPTLTFTIRNIGPSDLLGIGVSIDGAQAADFELDTGGMATTLALGSTTTFTVTFTPGPNGPIGARTAKLHIASSDPVLELFDVSLTGNGFVLGLDSDGDGMSDWAEMQLKNLGFDWQVSQPARVSALFTNANVAGLFTQSQYAANRTAGQNDVINSPNTFSLYTLSQIQDLNVGIPLLTKDMTTGEFKLTIGIEKSSDLIHFDPLPFTEANITINAQGQIEFLFLMPEMSAFFRLQSH